MIPSIYPNYISLERRKLYFQTVNTTSTQISSFLRFSIIVGLSFFWHTLDDKCCTLCLRSSTFLVLFAVINYSVVPLHHWPISAINRSDINTKSAFFRLHWRSKYFFSTARTTMVASPWLPHSNQVEEKFQNISC